MSEAGLPSPHPLVRLADSFTREEAELLYHVLRSLLLDQFARGEAVIDAAITRLCAAGAIESNVSAPTVPTRRLHALKEALKSDLSHNSHAKPSLKKLEAWSAKLETRNAMAHATLSVEAHDGAPGGFRARLSWYLQGEGCLAGVKDAWEFPQFFAEIELVAEQVKAMKTQLGHLPAHFEKKIAA